MTSAKLRIGTAAWEPEAYACSLFTLTPHPARCPHPGIDVEILEYILSLKKIHYELIPYTPPVDWGDHVNETWTGVLGDIYNGIIDTTIFPYFSTEERIPDFDFSFPVLAVPWVFIFKRETSTEIADSALLVFKVFTPILWGLFVIVILLVSTLILLLQPLECKFRQENGSGLSVRSMWRLICTLFIQQSYDMRLTLHSGSFLLLIFSFITFFATSLYQNAIFTHVFPSNKVKEQFSSVSQIVSLIEKGRYSLIDMGGFAYFEQLLVSDLKHYVAMRKAIRNNPVVAESNFTKVVRMLETGRYILPQYSLVALQFLQSSCSLTSYINDEIGTSWQAYMFKKNSSWLNKFNQGIITADNYPQHVVRKYEVRLIADCHTMHQLEKPLPLHSFLGLFLAYSGGMLMSIIGFTIELLLRRLLKCGFWLVDYEN